MHWACYNLTESTVVPLLSTPSVMKNGLVYIYIGVVSLDFDSLLVFIYIRGGLFYL
jgi:hypothetical protein